MELNASLYLALVLLALSALVASFCVMRVGHPSTHPNFDAAFATAFTGFHVAFLALATTYIPVAARAPLLIKTQAIASCLACVAGVWLSVAISFICARYDSSLLQLKVLKIPRRGWPWATFPASLMHVIFGIALGSLTIMCWSFAE